MLFKWKGANKKSHQKWDFIVNLVLWLVKQRVTWPFSGDFWRKTTTKPPRKTTTNHHKPLRTTTNHYEPPQTTTNHHEPPQSLIQNEIWYWILDSDWLNSQSHDIFLRILENNYHEPPRTTTNHDSEPWQWTMTWTTTVNHDIWTMTWTMTVNHDIWTTTNHDEIVSFAGGSRRRECTVLEILTGFRPRKQAEIAVLGLIRVSQVTCLVVGFKKSAEIAVLGLIRVSQENWKLFFVILVKYFIILSNLEAFSR